MSLTNIQKAAQTLLAASMRLDDYGYKNEADRLDVIAEHLTRRLVLSAREQEEAIRRAAPRQRKIQETPAQIMTRIYKETMQREASAKSQLQPYDSCLKCSEYLFTGEQAYQVHDGTVLHLRCVPAYLSEHSSYSQRIAVACDEKAKDNKPHFDNLSEEQVNYLLPGRITILD